VPQALDVKELVTHDEWEPDAQPLTVLLNEAVTELQGLSVGLRVAQALAVKEPDAHAE